MPRRALFVTLVALASSAATAGARADVVGAPTPAPPPMPTPLDRLGGNLADAFTGAPLFLYAGAVATTGALALSGGDHDARVFVQEHFASPTFGTVMVYVGYGLPVLVAPSLYVAGLVVRDRTLAGAGAAATQALAVTATTTVLLKWTTGRVYPTNGGDPNDPARLSHPEYARELHPFDVTRGLAAWPSGHTSASVSVAAALTAYYPEEVWVPLVGYPVALAIAAGMLAGDRHWLSDVVAGGLIGHGIGYSIGRSMRRLHREGRSAEAARDFTVVPLIGDGAGATYGLAIAGAL